MINIDVVTIHPRSLDYPQFRSQLQWFSPYFQQIIIVFSGRGEQDYSQFIRNNMGTVQLKTTFIDGRDHRGDEDWRDVAVNEALPHVTSEWVLFLEQDFFWKDKTFWDKLLEKTKEYDAISFWEAGRLHPAFLLVKTEWIAKTNRYFGTQPEIQLDHFGMFSRELKNNGARIGELRRMDLHPQKDFYHMQGITHNYNLFRSGQTQFIFKRHEFLTYNDISRKVKETQDPTYLELSRKVSDLGGFYEKVDWLADFWKHMI